MWAVRGEPPGGSEPGEALGETAVRGCAYSPAHRSMCHCCSHSLEASLQLMGGGGREEKTRRSSVIWLPSRDPPGSALAPGCVELQGTPGTSGKRLVLQCRAAPLGSVATSKVRGWQGQGCPGICCIEKGGTGVLQVQGLPAGCSEGSSDTTLHWG